MQWLCRRKLTFNEVTRHVKNVEDFIEALQEPWNQIIEVSGGREQRKKRAFAHKDHIVPVRSVDDISEPITKAAGWRRGFAGVTNSKSLQELCGATQRSHEVMIAEMSLAFRPQRPERSRPQGETWRGVCLAGRPVVSTRRDRSVGPLDEWLGTTRLTQKSGKRLLGFRVVRFKFKRSSVGLGRCL